MKRDATDYKFYFDSLKKSTDFSRLSDDIINDMLEMFYVETWAKGQMYFNGDKLLYRFHYVVSGRIKMYQIHPEKGNEHTLYINTSGDFFDLICLLDNKNHNIQMEALDDIVLLSAPMDIVREWILKHPSFNRIFLPYIAKQLRKMEDKANDLALFDTWTRTLKLFIKHSNKTIHDTELKLINNLTNSEIAHIVGTSKNIINLHLQKLKKKDIIEVKRHKIKLKKYNDLLELLENK